MTKDSQSLEEMLKAVIEAQDTVHPRKGIGAFKFFDDPHVLFEGIFSEDSGRVLPYSFHLLQILLDPQGLRAAYPNMEYRIETEDRRKDILMNAVVNHMKEKGHLTLYHEYVAQIILMAWLTKPEGDAVGAIRTAYELLP